MSGLGFRQQTGTLSSDGQNPYGDGNWVVAFTSQDFAVGTNRFLIYHMALTGPLGSQVQVWADRTFYDITNHGDINSWDPNEPLALDGGKTLYMYWNSGIAPTPMVTVWLREPPIL